MRALKSKASCQNLGETAIGEALSARLLSETDLLRLKAIARLHARGLPPGIGWMDLLQEAILRMLQGSRRKPPDLPIVAFLAGVMRSIRSEHWRRAQREADAQAWLAAESGPSVEPEERLAAVQALAAIDRLFAHDPQALQIIAGLGEGLTAERIREVYCMSKTDYDSTRKRMRRALLREGLAWRRP
ncbi:MAG TPA: sigma-70 family RNA polymerase sigma factor [Alphaproteobacteria bacterium]|nr:sigma-70 family RNA polymerase sigma factor [Alphaproteobacteria bacterium]